MRTTTLPVLFLVLLSGSILRAQMNTENLNDKIPLHRWNVNPFSYSRGYKMGFLNRVGVEGIFIKTLEGQLYLGVRSSIGKAINQECFEIREKMARDIEDPVERDNARQKATEECQITINPSEFSSLSTGYLDDLTKIGDPLLIYTVSYYLYPFTNTDNIIQQAWPVRPSRKLEADHIDRLDQMFFSKYIHYKDGVIEGRFVSATVERFIRQNYEVVIQAGPSGNNFSTMNIEHTDIFDFAVQAMSTGRYLRIHYLRLFDFESLPEKILGGYRTPFRIYRIEVIREPTSRIDEVKPKN